MLQNLYTTTHVTNSSKKILIRYLQIIWKFVRKKKYDVDVVFVGFLGQPMIPFIRVLWRGPLVFDAFLSLYDTLCFDRKWVSPKSIIGRLAWWVDKISCQLADIVILDTQAHADYFERTFNVPRNKLKVLFVSCDKEIFVPRHTVNRYPTVLFYGSFLPLQGVDSIVRAAALLADTPIQFCIIGDGLMKQSIDKLVTQLKVPNLTFVPPVPLTHLPELIASASVCLGGHFGPSDKARRVIAGKTFQCLAMGKPTVVGDNNANRELMTHGKDAWFCEMENPEALANAVRTLIENPELRERLGKQACKTFIERASPDVVQEGLKEIIDRAVGMKIKR